MQDRQIVPLTKNVAFLGLIGFRNQPYDTELTSHLEWWGNTADQTGDTETAWYSWPLLPPP